MRPVHAFLYFTVFNLCFFGLQLLFIHSQAGSFIHSLPLPWSIYAELFKTLFIQGALYLLLALIQTLLLHNLLRRSWHYYSAQTWILLIWGLCVGAILMANAYYFPLSQFSKLLAPPLLPRLVQGLLLLFCAALGLLVLNGVALHSRSLSVILVCVFLGGIISHHIENPILKENNLSKPNIIILGIDSLSPLHVTHKTMPFLYKLLDNSTQFTQTISPLARTYPAWSTILTGLYAKHHKAEENLVAKTLVASNKSIVWQFNTWGYQTLFATDDRRFNGISTDFGFQHIIGPKLGVNDVLLGSFNDFPLGNLLINTHLGAWIFPYNTMSRASFFSYYPIIFNQQLQGQLTTLPQQSPIFLAVHFTLPHWPYAFATSRPENVNNEFSLKKRGLLYLQALKAVDIQLHTMLTFLKQHHYLNNSILVLLSDHGEVLYTPGSRHTKFQNYQGNLPSPLNEYFKNKTATDLDKSAGHGSDILSPEQYHCVLGFYRYQQGKKISSRAKINTRVALIDLAPTLLDVVHSAPTFEMDGLSLMDIIQHPTTQIQERTFFIESGMFPNQEISKKRAIGIGKKLYQVNPSTTELEIKPEQLPTIMRQKLYGVIQGSWVFALYPNQKTYIPVIQNLATGQWSDKLEDAFATASPAPIMYQELQKFYHDELVLDLTLLPNIINR
jgi:hypothetical protein